MAYRDHITAPRSYDPPEPAPYVWDDDLGAYVDEDGEIVDVDALRDAAIDAAIDAHIDSLS